MSAVAFILKLFRNKMGMGSMGGFKTYERRTIVNHGGCNIMLRICVTGSCCWCIAEVGKMALEWIQQVTISPLEFP